MGSLERMFSIGSPFLGPGPILYAWHPKCALIAAVGVNNTIHLFDRQGQPFEQLVISLSGDVTGLDWDAQGKSLAILTSASNGRFAIWSQESKRCTLFKTNCKDLSILRWSKTSSYLGLFGSKGRIVVYNKETQSSTPVEVTVQDVTERVIYAEWEGPIMAVVFADRRIVVVNASGRLLEDIGGSPKFRLAPLDVQLCPGPANSVVLAVNLGNKALFVTSVFKNFLGNVKSYELQFPPRCGSIVAHRWLRQTGELLVCFNSGTVALIPALQGPDVAARDSVFAHDVVNGQVRGMAVSSDSMVAIVEEDAVRIFSTTFRSLYSPSLVIECDRRIDVESVEWAPGGSILTLSCPSNSCLHSVLVYDQPHDFREVLRNISSNRALLSEETLQPLSTFRAWRQVNFLLFSLPLVEPLLAVGAFIIFIAVAIRNDLLSDLQEAMAALAEDNNQLTDLN